MTAAMINDNERDDGAHGHQALYAEVQDAGALGNKLAQGCQQKRSCGCQHAG